MIPSHRKRASTRLRAGGLLAALLLCTAHPGLGQAPAADAETLVGEVVKSGASMPGVPVTLHRVTQTASGPVASTETNASGRFSFVLPPPDTGSFSVFFVTAEYRTVRYFGAPVHRDRPVEPYRVEVFDTASFLPGAIRVARRDLVLLPETEGGWQVNEILRIHNGADRTLVSPDQRPTWQFRLPDGATDFEAGEGDEPAREVERKGDWIFLRSSLVPGDRELFVRYRLPAQRQSSDLVLASATDTLNVFVRQPAPELRITGMTSTRVIQVEQERFVQYGAANLEEQTTVTLEWRGAAAPPVDPVLAAVVVAVLVLAGGTWTAARSRGGA